MIIPAVERTERCAAAEWKTRRDEFMAGRSLGVARSVQRALLKGRELVWSGDDGWINSAN